MNPSTGKTETEGSEIYIRPLSVFFFFALMNEEKAISYTINVLDKIKKINNKKNIPVLVVKMATEIVYDSDLKQVYITKGLNENWILPKGLDIGPWKEFHKKISKEEMISLLWSHVIKMDEATVLEALEINIGTHHYRISNALKKIGKITFSLS